MPYGGTAELLSSLGFSPALCSNMSFMDGLNTRRVRTPRPSDVRGRLFRDNGMPSGPNQKDVLKNLNDRLAAYLEKVRLLEESNGRLEQQIKELVEKRSAVVQDNRRHEKTIAELESQIKEVKVANAELCLGIDNVKLTADVFKAKYESERSLRQAILSDIKELKTSRNDLGSQIAILEVEEQILTEELACLRRDNKEDIERRQAQTQRDVNVEVRSPQSSDLTKALEEMRAQYCAIADQHQRDTDAWFTHKAKEPIPQSRSCMESLQNHKGEAAALRRALQDLEVEVEVLYNMKYAQEVTLCEMDAGYSTHLQNIQELVCKRENELGKIRADAAQLSSDSRILLYLKDLLEMEIRTYGMLMDEEELRLEEVNSEASYGASQLSKQKQMYMLLISEASSVITKYPPLFEDLESEGEKRVGQ